MKTQSSVRLNWLFLVGLVMLFQLVYIMYQSGNLAWVEHHHFGAKMGDRDVACTVTKYTGVMSSLTVIKGVDNNSFGTQVGEIIVDKTVRLSGGDIATINSMGYDHYGLYGETVLDQKNPLGWACQKGGGEITYL